MSLMSKSGPAAIDPPGCGCTECMTGEYVPLDRASKDQILDLIAGRLRDNTNTSTEFSVLLSVNEGDYNWRFSAAEVIDAVAARGGAR